jgi:glycosyltransferase involved in cell wall biosynthesis
MRQADWVAYLLLGLYGLTALVGFLNLLLMRHPHRLREGLKFCILIPARDEAENLRRLIPSLREFNPEIPVLVFDDESTDATAAVSKSLGATVVSPSESLPQGWTGKNRACHELAKAAAQLVGIDWFLFLDADVYPSPEFIPAMRSLCAEAPPSVGVVTGFPQIQAGRGLQPLFLAWVGWVLLCTTPYGLICRTGKGHVRFKNGQVHAWRREVYLALMPNEAVRTRIMEDVEIGRLLARKGVGVEVANLSSVFGVRMYETWQETLDGMSKNSFEITGSVAGSIAIAASFLVAGWGWLFMGRLMPYGLGLMFLSGVFTVMIVRTVFWPALLAPVIPTIGAYTIIRSAIWHKTGRVRWKGRLYPGL